jgi:hypothetical protein
MGVGQVILIIDAALPRPRGTWILTSGVVGEATDPGAVTLCR